MARTVFKLTHKGIMARWVLQFMSGFSGEPFCRTASWMVETCPRTLESEDSILRVFCMFWDSRLKAAGK
jgi:hypothetical protein